jgi:amino acid permease
MFPVTVVMEEWFAPPHCRLQELRRYAVRLVLVTITILMAAFIPEFGLFISFIGSFSNSFAGFILPQIFFLKLCWHTSTRGEKVANCFIIVFGLLGGGISSVISMQNIIETLSKKYG